jgi:signal transduction histidine kinase
VPNGTELRAVSLVDHFGQTPFNVVVASDFTPIQQAVQGTRILLIVFTLTSLAAAGVTSWNLIHQSLKPVAGVVREARRIRADQLHRRISRPETEGEIREMIDVINGMLDRLEKDFNNQKQFVAHVSHELKTPLAVLLTEAQTLSAGGSDLEAYEAFRQVALDETRKLLRIVESFLLLTRARTGTRPAVEVDVPLEEILIEATRRVQTKAKNFQVRVVPRLEFPEDNPAPLVRGDSDLLYTMIENLVRNAIRYSPPGAEVEVVAEANSKLARISVLDRGSGVPKKDLDKIFDKFYQVSPEGKKAGKLGIGLTIAQAVAELHGGSITAMNREGGGMQFDVLLPIVNS